MKNPALAGQGRGGCATAPPGRVGWCWFDVDALIFLPLERAKLGPPSQPTLTAGFFFQAMGPQMGGRRSPPALRPSKRDKPIAEDAISTLTNDFLHGHESIPLSLIST